MREGGFGGLDRELLPLLEGGVNLSAGADDIRVDAQLVLRFRRRIAGSFERAAHAWPGLWPP